MCVGAEELLTESIAPCKALNPSFTGKTWSLPSAIFASWKINKYYNYKDQKGIYSFESPLEVADEHNFTEGIAAVVANKN